MENTKLNEVEKFEIWELARKVCNYQDQVTIFEVIDHCRSLGKEIKISLIEQDELPSKINGVLIIVDGVYNILRPHPPKASELEKLKKWFKVSCHEIYHCFDGVPLTNFSAITDEEKEKFLKGENKADYFSDIVVFYLKHGAETLNKIYESFRDPKRIFSLINQLRKKRILLLGKYPDEGGKRLRDIERSLLSKGFKPVIFGDLDDIHLIIEKGEVKEEVLTVAKLSEMVIVDDSEASGHLLELADLSANLIPTAILRYEGMGSTILSESFFKKNKNFIKVFKYNNDTINTVLNEIIDWFTNLHQNNDKEG